ncbi:MAG: guanylate kinase [Lachnospiraceae bacterium]|nr:guanylate kinase [Lachnospiraceae bacterium]
MGKLYVIIGKSASGKDTLARKLLDYKTLDLRPVVTYTTRPIRKGEKEGEDYHFCTLRQFWTMRENKKIIELRSYNTVYGEWNYFTVDDGQIDLDSHSNLTVGTLDSLKSFRKYFGYEKIVPIYVEVDDGERLQRALDREKQEKEPKYDELCRRFLADQQDFSEENIRKARILYRYQNHDSDKTAEEIAAMIKGDQNGY